RGRPRAASPLRGERWHRAGTREEGEARGLGRERLALILLLAAASRELQPHQPSRHFLAASAAHPRRDNSEWLEAELLQNPRRGGVVEKVRTFEALQAQGPGDLDECR